ncbi:MAG: homoserine dehydrogenase [Alphaproteobacteria bacterium]
MSEPLRIAIAGLGTVGTGLIELLRENAALLERRCGRAIEVVAVSARDRARERGVDLGGFDWYDDAVGMASQAEVEIVVELIGGADGPAKAVCEAALGAGRSVVTANKALIAHHGTALARQAEDAGLTLAYEAAVAGGIPIIKALREGLAGNQIDLIYGILNGTCNYILSTMRDTGRDFDDVLEEAQQLGYAEADPGFDIDGIDAAHKLAILASVAYGAELAFDKVYVEGIRHVTALDIRFAGELGYRIKLLGIARRVEGGIEQRVHPCMVPLDSPIAVVEGVYNAVVAHGNFVGATVFEGKGAGAGPTASAVAADIIDCARGAVVPTFNVAAGALTPMRSVDILRHRGAYYIRLMVMDRPGVFADIAATLRDEEVSMEAILQRARAPGEPVPVVMTTHDAEEQAMRRVIERFAGFETVVETPCMIRIEQLPR